MKRAALLATAALLALFPAAALAQPAPAAGEDEAPAEGNTAPASDDAAAEATAPEEPLRVTGYLDVGFAKASGNGSSFAENDPRLPLDYGVDPFATAVNSRGEVASTDSGGRFTNGFLPRSAGLGNRASFLLNTASVDLRFQPPSVPLFLFARAQLMPRFLGVGDATRLELPQAFLRLAPLPTEELMLFLGRFDSVFGIEYLENEANLRTGVTPSLVARYTTGQSLGAKVLYRRQLPALSSTVSLNGAVTNHGTRVGELVPADASLTGAPVASARLGYELGVGELAVKLGVSGLYGPRNDQHSRDARQRGVGADLRVSLAGISLAGELVRLLDDRGPLEGKLTGEGTGELASAFSVGGGWVRLAWTLPLRTEVLNGVTVYGRYDARRAQFEGYTRVVTDRFTVGARVDLYERLAVKAEALFNRELEGAPTVSNDVFTTSAVLTW